MNISNRLFRSAIRFSSQIFQEVLPKILTTDKKAAPYEIIIIPNDTDSVIRKLSPMAYFLISNYLEYDNIKFSQSAIQNKLKHVITACLGPISTQTHEYIHLTTEPKIIYGVEPKLKTNKSSLNPVPWLVMWSNFLFHPFQMAILVTFKNMSKIFTEIEYLKFWSIISAEWMEGVNNVDRIEILGLTKKLFEQLAALVYFFATSLDLVQSETKIELLQFWSSLSWVELKTLLKESRIKNKENPLEPLDDFEHDFAAIQTVELQAKYVLAKLWVNNDNFSNSLLFPRHIFTKTEVVITHLCLIVTIGLNKLCDELQIIITIQAQSLIKNLQENFSEEKIKNEVKPTLTYFS